jgi:hypothetical protein
MKFFDNDFERSFNRGFKAVVFLQIVFVILIVTVIIVALTHPQAIGEFAGKIVNGFNTTAK